MPLSRPFASARRIAHDQTAALAAGAGERQDRGPIGFEDGDRTALGQGRQAVDEGLAVGAAHAVGDPHDLRLGPSLEKGADGIEMGQAIGQVGKGLEAAELARGRRPD